VVSEQMNRYPIFIHSFTHLLIYHSIAMKYYLIAGERSGDLHAANLIKALKTEDPQAEFRAWGGEGVQAAGADLVTHYREMAFMGFLEVIKNLRTINGFLKTCRRDILAWQPDVVILVDYAGFNMRIAKFCKQHGIRTFYYISPKVWAWNQKRAYKIKANVDRMFVIFPFEKDFFKRFDYDVDYVGNPLLDEISAFRPNPNFLADNQLSDKPIIALLPGSRRQEVEKMLTLMVQAAQLLETEMPGQYQFAVAGVGNLPTDLYERILSGKIVSFEKTKPAPIINVVCDQSYDLLSHATSALVTSGTATLETALFGVPQVVCYRTSGFSYQIAKALIKVKYLSLVNIIADAPVVPELIQDELTPQNSIFQLSKTLPGAPERETQLAAYRKLKNLLGEPGASKRTARLMVQHLS
jgi:lipid-A-disaccharide synthase